MAETFPKTGYYKNDCPFCQTHNAILYDTMIKAPTFIDPNRHVARYFCRDCGRYFTDDNETVCEGGGKDYWRLLPGNYCKDRGR